MTTQTNTDKVKEETVEEALDSSIRFHERLVKSKSVKEILFALNKIKENGKQPTYTPSEVNTILEKLRERCIAACSDFLSEGNIREIDYSDLLNK